MLAVHIHNLAVIAFVPVPGGSAVCTPADFTCIHRVHQYVLHKAVVRWVASVGFYAHGVQLHSNFAVAFARQKSIKDVPNGGCVLVGCEHLVLKVIAKGTGAHSFATARLFRHATGHFLGQAGAVILVHEFYNALDQRGKGRVVYGLGYGDHRHADAPQHGLIYDAFFLVAGKPAEFPYKNCLEWVLLAFCKGDHIIERLALFNASPGDTIVIEYIFIRHAVAVSAGVLTNELKLAVRAVLVLPVITYADICCCIFHCTTPIDCT